MSVVLVVFPGAPKVSPEAQLKDVQLNQLLEKKVQGKCCYILFHMMMTHLISCYVNRAVVEKD